MNTQNSTMKVSEFLTTVKDGDELGWPTHFEVQRNEDGHLLRPLAASILADGIREPILIGNDGRLWDGHHRVYLAHHLGLEEIPVTYAPPTNG